ncbi:MAG: endonuclease/exonuclease/phosphatase family protein [Planctomycetaceae bacterium]
MVPKEAMMRRTATMRSGPMLAGPMLAVTFLLAGPALARAEAFRLLAWNVESNRPGQPPVSDARVIADQLSDLVRAPATRAEIVALSEVEPKTVWTYRQAVADGLGGDVDFVTSASGGYADADSLMLVVDARRFRIDEVIELHRYAGIRANFPVNDESSSEHGSVRGRSPLIARLHDLVDGRDVWVIVNHLARGENDLRTDQARALRRWAADRREPVIAAGDFNFDYEFQTAKGNPAFDAMLEGGTWTWVKPDPLVDSNWSEDRKRLGPGVDSYPGSILDFVFVANAAKEWHGESDVIVRSGDFPDDNRTSDHRPIVATFRPAP